MYVDLSGDVEAKGLCLVKATEPQYDLATASTIRLSLPKVFRHTGEVLIQDEQEGRARTSTSESVDVPSKEPELVGERVSALNAALQLGRMKMSVSGSDKSKRSNTSAAAVTFGRDFLIYSTSMQPSKDEEEAWRRSLPDRYTSFTPIYRPTQFAQGLGLGVCEHIGARGEANPARAVFNGFRTVEERRRGQMVLHGPMLYVDSPYRCIAEAEPGWEKLSAMIFLKSRERDYAAQKEYRVAILSIGPEVGDVFDLPVSGVLKDCLSPVKYPEEDSEETVAVVSKEESSGSEERPTRTTYTYRRRISRREQSSWNLKEPGSGRSNEKVVEEIVTSPEEVPEPFPSGEERRPDVIVFHQVGTRFRFIHRAYRDEETKHWRVETLPGNSTVVDGPANGDRPVGLVVPPVSWTGSNGRERTRRHGTRSVSSSIGDAVRPHPAHGVHHSRQRGCGRTYACEADRGRRVGGAFGCRNLPAPHRRWEGEGEGVSRRFLAGGPHGPRGLCEAVGALLAGLGRARPEGRSAGRRGHDLATGAALNRALRPGYRAAGAVGGRNEGTGRGGVRFRPVILGLVGAVTVAGVATVNRQAEPG